MRASSGTCAGSAPALQSGLRISAAKTLPTTVIDRSPYDLTGGDAQIAHGTAADVLTFSYSQPVAGSESLRSGCQYQITLTFTATG
jgi:hypothetical protein